MNFLAHLATLALTVTLSISAFAQDLDFSKVEIKTQKLSKNVHMLEGMGGNMGLIVSDDGVLLIDDQFAPLSEKILAAIGKLTKQPVKFVVNTHWHYDHVGGNENFGKSGSIIVAHENVRKTISKDQLMKAFNRKIPATKKEGLPVITFTSDMKFHFSDEEVSVIHVPNAHTNGDSIVHFKKANVIHTGDTFVNGAFPFVDVQSGGSVDGIIASAKKVLEMADSSTKIIPGHGPLASTKDLKAFLSMMEDARTRMAPLVEKKMKREEVVKANPYADLDAKYGKGFLNTEKFTGFVYDSLVAKK